MKNQYIVTIDRRIAIFKKLINHQHLSYTQLSTVFFVSRSSIAKDIAYLKELFSKEGLRLQFDYTGTFFSGSESQIHRVYKRYILMMLEETEILSSLIDIDTFQEINKVFRNSLVRKEIDIPESYVRSIVVSIYLLIERTHYTNKIVLEDNASPNSQLLDYDSYPLIFDLLQEFEDRNIYHFSSDEIKYLTILIVGSGFNVFVKNEKIPFAFRGKVRRLIQNISEGVGIDLTNDAHLEEQVTSHLYQLTLRGEAQTTIVNPLLDEIKIKYSALFGVVWFSIHDFLKKYQSGVSDDEIGFILLHFQAAIERITIINRIVFVCPNGVGTSALAIAKLRRILPDNNRIDVMSVQRLHSVDMSTIDFIISTVEILNIDKPIVQISPLVTNQDIKNVMYHYIDLVFEKNKEEISSSILIDQIAKLNLFVFSKQVRTKEEGINFLIDHNRFDNDYQKMQFRESVSSREKLQSTYLDNGFAIPHGHPDYVSETSISILLLDKPIYWGNHLVDVIVLLMIKEEETQEVESMMKLIMHGVEEKEWFKSKMLEVRK